MFCFFANLGYRIIYKIFGQTCLNTYRLFSAKLKNNYLRRYQNIFYVRLFSLLSNYLQIYFRWPTASAGTLVTMFKRVSPR